MTLRIVTGPRPPVPASNVTSFAKFLLRRTLRALGAERAAIDEILRDGRVAVVVFEPLGRAQAAARVLGWDGSARVFEMSGYAIALLTSSGGEAAASWLSGTNVGRLLVLTRASSLLVHVVAREGYEILSFRADRDLHVVR